MKQVLDIQILRTQQAKQVSAAEKKAAFDQVQQDVKHFEEEQERKKLGQMEVRKSHQKEVTRQIEDRKRLLKHVGSQVIVN
jgi:hypothetical protein